MLYQPGDYSTAVEQIRRLITDKAHAEAVAVGGRREVELWGWSAATRNLRTIQYKKAINNQRAHKRFGFLALRTGIARLLRIFNLMTLVSAIVSFLDYAQPFRQPPSPKPKAS